MLTPIDLTLPDTDEVYRYKVGWWKVLTDIVVAKGRTQPAIKEWKQHTLWVSNTIFGRDPQDPFPDYKPSWPPLPEGTWLTSGVRNAEIIASAVEYCITRTFPSADGRACAEALEETRATYCDHTPVPITEGDRAFIETNSRIAGAEIRKCALEKGVLSRCHSHCSLTNRGCLERSSKDGGKKAEIIPGFLEWLETNPPSDEVWELPTGGYFSLKVDQPRWKAEIPNIRDLPQAEIGEEIDRSGWIHPELVGMEEHRLAVLLHTYCYVMLVQDGYMEQNGRPTGRMFTTLLTSMGEPGGKARIPSKSAACLTTYLQPYAHVMRNVLECDPTLTSGLSAGNQAWELVKDLKRSWGTEFRGTDLWEGILLGDLERSTDFIEYEAGNLHMNSFWESWDGVSDYFRYAHELILQPFVVQIGRTKDISTRGALMGLPGTKIILHTISKAVDVAASRRTTPLGLHDLRRHPWRCAGDDIIRLGSLTVNRRYKPSAVRYRVKPSDDKWGVYTHGGKYCERAIFLDGSLDTDDMATCLYQDIIPMRLLSPETKPRTGDDDTNPVFGKGHALARELEWYSGPADKRSKALALFLENMREYGDVKPIMFVPRHLGGLGLSHDLEKSFKYTPETIKKACKFAYANAHTPKGELARRALQSLRTPILQYRGAPIPLKEVVNPFSWIVEYLPVASTQQMRDNLEIPEGMRYIRAQKELEDRGYVDIGKILRETQSGERAPFWELAKRKQRKGWSTAPISRRVEAVAASLPELEAQPLVTVEEWQGILSNPDDLRPDPVWVHRDDLTVIVDQTAVPLNLKGAATGLSLKMGISNRTLFEKSAR
jgi:hypothetical protein